MFARMVVSRMPNPKAMNSPCFQNRAYLSPKTFSAIMPLALMTMTSPRDDSMITAPSRM